MKPMMQPQPSSGFRVFLGEDSAEPAPVIQRSLDAESEGNSGGKESSAAFAAEGVGDDSSPPRSRRSAPVRFL